MSAGHDKEECGISSPSEDIYAQETGEAQRDNSAQVRVPCNSLADFARRVRACDTRWRLEMLHSLMLRTVPVGQRAEYVALLNQRDEELLFKHTEAEWWV
ncbi:hypothetical protein FWL67_19160 [Salmonella enterica]|nr:hypothetical protein [Salmonella enterica]